MKRCEQYARFLAAAASNARAMESGVDPERLAEELLVAFENRFPDAFDDPCSLVSALNNAQLENAALRKQLQEARGGSVTTDAMTSGDASLTIALGHLGEAIQILTPLLSGRSNIAEAVMYASSAAHCLSCELDPEYQAGEALIEDASAEIRRVAK